MSRSRRRSRHSYVPCLSGARCRPSLQTRHVVGRAPFEPRVALHEVDGVRTKEGGGCSGPRRDDMQGYAIIVISRLKIQAAIDIQVRFLNQAR